MLLTTKTQLGPTLLEKEGKVGLNGTRSL